MAAGWSLRIWANRSVHLFYFWAPYPFSSHHPPMSSIPGFEVRVLGGGHHPSFLLRLDGLALPLGFPFFTSVHPLVRRLLRPPKRLQVALGPGGPYNHSSCRSPRLAASHTCCCTVETLNAAAVIKARSPLLSRKRSTPQIPHTTYGPINFPKRSLFARFKQGLISQTEKTLFSRNTQQRERACTGFSGFFL